MEYNKLVRDKIPEIIENNGEQCSLRILEDGEYRNCLYKKLDEEVAEFHRDRNLEELADILEVVYALADSMESRQKLMDVYNAKHQQRGGFEKKIFLISKE